MSSQLFWHVEQWTDDVLDSFNAKALSHPTQLTVASVHDLRIKVKSLRWSMKSRTEKWWRGIIIQLKKFELWSRKLSAYSLQCAALKFYQRALVNSIAMKLVRSETQLCHVNNIIYLTCFHLVFEHSRFPSSNSIIYLDSQNSQFTELWFKLQTKLSHYQSLI